MDIGFVFPHNEIGADVGAITALAQAADDLGYSHVTAYDHVLGADRTVHRDLTGPYAIEHTFHEVFVLFGYLAGITRLGFATGILIAPQRQTALIAKQAAQIDIVAPGRLRLGVGLGWNTVEYEALGEDFSTRAARIEEQILLLRRLWTEENVTFNGTFDTVTSAGLAPLPPTQPIPIWMGGMAKPALERVGRLADGWFPMALPGGTLEEGRAIIDAAATDAGRDPSAIAMEGQVSARGNGRDRLVQFAERWREAGASHLSINTMSESGAPVDDHIALLVDAADQLGLKGAS